LIRSNFAAEMAGYRVPMSGFPQKKHESKPISAFNLR
jgi:hypothetical protein